MSMIYLVFYLSSLVLAAVCVFTANNMSRTTCPCMKVCLIMVTLGLICSVLTVFYELPRWAKLVSTLPILWGVTGWLVFDRYRAHEDLNQVRNYILDKIYYLKQLLIGR